MPNIAATMILYVLFTLTLAEFVAASLIHEPRLPTILQQPNKDNSHQRALVGTVSKEELQTKHARTPSRLNHFDPYLTFRFPTNVEKILAI
jgi:hypothetical protein